MPFVTPYTFVALSTLTAAQLNGIQSNIAALWPYQAAGDIGYASAADVLSILAKGTAHQKLKMNAGATAPEWGSDKIQEYILTDVAASITFSNIPSTYRHLKLICDVRGDATSAPQEEMYIRFNNDSTSGNYDYQTQGRVYTSSVGTCIYSTLNKIWIADIPDGTAIAGASAPLEALIPNYAGTTFRKSVLSSFGYFSAESTSGLKIGQHVGFWESSAAISRIDLLPESGNFVSGSYFGLYGIL